MSFYITIICILYSVSSIVLMYPNPNLYLTNISNIAALILLQDLESYLGNWRSQWWDRYKVWREEKLRRSAHTLGPEAINFRHTDELSSEDDEDGEAHDDGHYQDIPPGPVEPHYPPRGRVRFQQCNTEDWSREWVQWDHSDCSLESDKAERFGDTVVGDSSDICNFGSIAEDLENLHDSVRGVMNEVEELADSVSAMATGRIVRECVHCGAVTVTVRNGSD